MAHLALVNLVCMVVITLTMCQQSDTSIAIAIAGEQPTSTLMSLQHANLIPAPAKGVAKSVKLHAKKSKKKKHKKKKPAKKVVPKITVKPRVTSRPTPDTTSIPIQEPETVKPNLNMAELPSNPPAPFVPNPDLKTSKEAISETGKPNLNMAELPSNPPAPVPNADFKIRKKPLSAEDVEVVEVVGRKLNMPILGENPTRSPNLGPAPMTEPESEPGEITTPTKIKEGRGVQFIEESTLGPLKPRILEPPRDGGSSEETKEERRRIKSLAKEKNIEREQAQNLIKKYRKYLDASDDLDD